jgi:hypothetical protein
LWGWGLGWGHGKQREGAGMGVRGPSLEYVELTVLRMWGLGGQMQRDHRGPLSALLRPAALHHIYLPRVDASCVCIYPASYLCMLDAA